MRRFISMMSACCLVGITMSAWAADTRVDLELVLAVDVSQSMDADEQRTQREGYVEAFRHPAVMQAINSGEFGRIAVAYLEWARPGFATVAVPWTRIGSRLDAEDFAAKLSVGAALFGDGYFDFKRASRRQRDVRRQWFFRLPPDDRRIG